MLDQLPNVVKDAETARAIPALNTRNDAEERRQRRLVQAAIFKPRDPWTRDLFKPSHHDAGRKLLGGTR
jgi:hypothetical protein